MKEQTQHPSSAYARSGVDIKEADRLKSRLPQLIQSTHGPAVLGRMGGFGGLFRLAVDRYRDPVLVSSADGVGTKLKVAFATGRHDTIGEDLVNHCVNDIAVMGATPLFFLDYLASGSLVPEVFEAVLTGLTRGCRNNDCALIGGETAQMPGFYREGEYDINGTIVGITSHGDLLDGGGIRPGDIILGLPSDGLHTNGYALARSILFEKMSLKIGSRIEELEGTLGEELLRVHRSYLAPIRALIESFNKEIRTVRAFAHITGGGLAGNIPRILPQGVGARIFTELWEIPPVFRILQEGGAVDQAEMYQVFNMGIGLVAVVDSSSAHAILKHLERIDSSGIIIGDIVEGESNCRLLASG